MRLEGTQDIARLPLELYSTQSQHEMVLDAGNVSKVSEMVTNYLEAYSSFHKGFESI